jgi:hypothetical protein
LTLTVMDRMLAGVSTCRFASVGERVDENTEQASLAADKSTVAHLSIERHRTPFGELMGRRPDDVRFAVMTLNGLEIADHTYVEALGIAPEGANILLGLWDGSTENPTLARTLLPIWWTAAFIAGRRSCSWSTDGSVAPRDRGRVRRARAGASLPSSRATAISPTWACATGPGSWRSSAVVADQRRARRAAARTARLRARANLARRRRFGA